MPRYRVDVLVSFGISVETEADDAAGAAAAVSAELARAEARMDVKRPAKDRPKRGAGKRAAIAEGDEALGGIVVSARGPDFGTHVAAVGSDDGGYASDEPTPEEDIRTASMLRSAGFDPTGTAVRKLVTKAVKAAPKMAVGDRPVSEAHGYPDATGTTALARRPAEVPAIYEPPESMGSMGALRIAESVREAREPTPAAPVRRMGPDEALAEAKRRWGAGGQIMTHPSRDMRCWIGDRNCTGCSGPGYGPGWFGIGRTWEDALQDAEINGFRG